MDKEEGDREQAPSVCAFDEGLEILGEAAGAVHPAKVALRDPARGRHAEAVGSRVASLEQLDPYPACPECSARSFVAGISTIDEGTAHPGAAYSQPDIAENLKAR